MRDCDQRDGAGGGERGEEGGVAGNQDNKVLHTRD